jgi:hypothetical protein
VALKVRKSFKNYDMKTHVEQYDVHFLKIQVYTHALKTKILYVAHTAENFWVRPCLHHKNKFKLETLDTTNMPQLL